ncbi:MAG: endolytic transglycosylase MltG [Hormoscilla sp. GM7CHS1pb]|nr:endolytic transglycosylase MltG [Hormoscilla sp. GM7CHS1pb]
MKIVSRISKWSFYLLIFPVVLGICGWQGWSWWSWATSPVSDAKSETAVAGGQVEIPLGTTSQEIGEILEAEGLIRSAKAWDLWSRWLRTQTENGDFQAGVYQLSPTQSMPEIADQIWLGKVVQTGYTIPEGWNIKQMAEYFEAQGFFSAAAFVAATRQNFRSEYPWLPRDLPHLEGFLYPDSYLMPKDAITPDSVVRQMLREFERVALPVYQQAKQHTSMSLSEWVTLASIVEKEAVVSSERAIIAGVFTQRLRLGMKLEADPTVEYGLGIRQTRDRPLTYQQVSTASPYNTYMNHGLPPTPIASPGVASLKATLYPEETDYLFFVARYNGAHIFSHTLAEHNAAIATVENSLFSR